MTKLCDLLRVGAHHYLIIVPGQESQVPASLLFVDTISRDSSGLRLVPFPPLGWRLEKRKGMFAPWLSLGST